MCDKYFNKNHYNLRPKHSEDKIKNKFNNKAYKRMETSIGKNNYSHNYIEIFPIQIINQNNFLPQILNQIIIIIIFLVLITILKI